MCNHYGCPSYMRGVSLVCQAHSKPRHWTYITRQIDLALGEQLRITVGRRTIFVYRNARGLHVRPRRDDGQHAREST